MDDEPDEFEWNRLSELQRRNTLCAPHLKTSYPVEIQMRPPREISERKLQKVVYIYYMELNWVMLNFDISVFSTA